MKVDNKLFLTMTAAIIGVLFVFGCEGGGGCGGGCGGCGGMDPLPGGYPGKLTDNLGNVRMTSHAITFLETNLAKIIGKFMPGGLSFAIPATTQTIQVIGYDAAKAYICEGNPCNDGVNPKCVNDSSGRPLTPKAPCCVCASIDAFDITTVNPNKLDLKVKLSVRETNGTAKVDVYTFFWWTLANCKLGIDIDKRDVSISATLTNEPSTKRMTIALGDPVFSITGSDIQLTGNWVCSIAGWDPIKNLLIDQILKSFDIKSIIDDALKAITCQPCPNGNECPTNMAPDVKCVGTKPEDKVCKNSNGAGACVPIPLGIEGVLDIGSLLASFAPGLTAKVTLAAEIGGANPNYVSDQGINMRLMGEVKSDHNICVPQTQPPMPSGASITYGNNSALCLRCTKAGDPCPSGSTCDENHMQCRKGDGTCPTVNYMAGIGINEYMVSKVLWAAFNSGALCLNIGSDTPGVSDYLTAGALAVFMPELKENIGGNAPAALALKPQMAPVLKVGAGIVKHDEKGNITLAKPLLSLNLPQVSIDFYVAMYDRYTRIFTVTTDIEVPVGLDIAPSKTKPGVIEILPIVSGLNLANAQITNWEIMAFPPDFIGLVNALVGQLLPSLLKPIEVDLSSSLQGFTLELLGIRGEVPFNPPRPEGCNDTDDDPKTACNYQFLSVYANLGLAAVNAAPVVTRAEVVSMAIPPVEKIRLMGTARGDAPVVHVRAAGDQDNLEFSYRIDSGLWSFYSPGPDVMVTGPALALPGRHSIEVRGRVVNMPYTTDLEGVKMEVTIDYTPPDISFSRAGDGSVTVNAVDLVSKEKVRVYYRASGTEDWIEIANGSVLPVVEGGKVEVRAVDEAGREAFAITAVGVKQTPSDRIGKADVSTSASGETAAGVDAAGCGCSTVSVEGQGATGLAGLLMALAALIAARRR